MNYQPIPVTEQSQSVSERIRARLMASGTRFHANDNIAAYIEPGEMDQLLDEVSARMQGVLESLVIDTVSDHNTQGTARRVAKMYLQEISVAATRRHRPSRNSPMQPC
jgi:GTP cyclohydrolase I